MPDYIPPSSGGGGGTPDDNSVTSAKIVDGTIVGGDLSSTIAIPSAATATTQSAADGSTKLATTAYVDTADALKANLASPTLTGTPAAPTAAQGTNTTQVATTAMVHSEAVLLAPLASPTFTGTPAAPTAAQGTNTTQLATTAFAAGMSGAVGGFAKIVRRSADATVITANTTLANDDTLLWSVGANEHWFFEGFLLVSAANSAMDIKLGWSVPSSCVMLWGGNSTPSNTLASYGPTIASGTPLALLAAGATAAYGTINGTTGIGITGVVQNSSTAGTVNLQVAQSTSDAGNLQLKADSFLRLIRLA